MLFIKRRKPHTLALILFSVILATICIMVAIFVSHRQENNKPGNLISTTQKEANLSIDRVHQTATKNGAEEWRLDAESAQYIDSKKQAIFQDLSVTFFLKDQRPVYLTANQGILKTDSNDIEITGNVIMKNENFRLNTENLYYDHHRRIIFTKVPVKIFGNAFDIVANAMSLDLNTKIAFLEGNVKGTFSENIKL